MRMVQRRMSSFITSVLLKGSIMHVQNQPRSRAKVAWTGARGGSSEQHAVRVTRSDRAYRFTAPQTIQYRVARTRREREAAFRLVYENYIAAGLIEPNSYRMRVTPYHLLPTTNVFVGTRGGEVLCTMTLIADGEMGLPMESIYADEVMRHREQGMYVGEVSCLATLESGGPTVLPMFLNLSRLV